MARVGFLAASVVLLGKTGKDTQAPYSLTVNLCFQLILSFKVEIMLLYHINNPISVFLNTGKHF